jgi:hypothetical protein
MVWSFFISNIKHVHFENDCLFTNDNYTSCNYWDNGVIPNIGEDKWEKSSLKIPNVKMWFWG